ncbi:MAG: hypothetical protein N2Z21_07380 [Candidatus Sumerlaeaceae bacterium]|nr:hypothetical protein [Candidatus Sumerlaeaceae bacterium]
MISMPEKLTITRGKCYALFAFDVGMSIDLDACDKILAEESKRGGLRHRRKAPPYFEYRPLPVRVTRRVQSFPIAQFRSEAQVEVTLFDFGAAQLIYSIPFSGSLEDLLELSLALYDNPLLLSDSRQQVEEVVHIVREAIQRPSISDFVEDYFIYEVPEFRGATSLENIISDYGAVIAQILRAENFSLSDQEVADALAVRMSCGPTDLALIDWASALVFDVDAEDVRTVLEFANVELLEMRCMDQELDDGLEQAYRTLTGPPKPWWRQLFSADREIDRVAQLQADCAMMFEGVNNALKLLGDQWLARLYVATSKRFHLPDWDASILRKLSTLESIYEKISDRASARRLEALEWIIIILIAISVIPTIPSLFTWLK